MTDISLSPEILRNTIRDINDPVAVHRLGVEAAAQANDRLNTGPIRRFFKNKKALTALLGVSALAVGGAGGYFAAGGAMPNFAGAGDSLSDAWSSVAALPGKAWNAIPGSDVAKGLTAGGLGVGAGFLTYAAGKAARLGTQETRDANKHVRKALRDQKEQLDTGSSVVIHHPHREAA